MGTVSTFTKLKHSVPLEKGEGSWARNEDLRELGTMGVFKQNDIL